MYHGLSRRSAAKGSFTLGWVACRKQVPTITALDAWPRVDFGKSDSVPSVDFVRPL